MSVVGVYRNFAVCIRAFECFFLLGHLAYSFKASLFKLFHLRERYHEIGRSEVPLEWHASDYILPGNANYDMVLWQQILAGDFIDYIFDEPDYIHELVRSQDLCLILKNMKEHQKQLLYYVVVRSYSTLQYAELNGKTDRNVRGVRETAIKQIRKKYKTALETRLLHLPWTLTLDEKYFLENGVRTKDEKNSEKQ